MRPMQETPVKSCENCGATFQRKRYGKRLEDRGAYMRRKFCCLSCSVSAQHRNPAPTEAASRKRAARLIGERCDSCGITENLCAHHINGDPMDNSLANIQTLCTNCHSFWHGLLNRTGRRPESPMPRMIEWCDCAVTATQSSRR